MSLRVRRAPPFILCAALLGLAGPALARDIDLSKPYGDTYGCINRNGQEVAADVMLLLTADSLVTAASACTIAARSANKDGSLTLKADCEAEGEEGTTPATFTVRRSEKTPKALVVSDESGFVMGEVAACK